MVSVVKRYDGSKANSLKVYGLEVSVDVLAVCWRGRKMYALKLFILPSPTEIKTSANLGQ